LNETSRKKLTQITVTKSPFFAAFITASLVFSSKLLRHGKRHKEEKLLSDFAKGFDFKEMFFSTISATQIVNEAHAYDKLFQTKTKKK
jgi:hypothetical protein